MNSFVTEENRQYDQRDLEESAALPRYIQWLMEDFRPSLRGKVIEVGAGIGTISEQYVDAVNDAILVEPAENLCRTLQGKFGAKKHVRCVPAMLGETIGKTYDGLEVKEGTFDAAIMVNVLEHIEDDGEVVRTLFKLLKPGGALLIFVPAMPFLYGTMDKHVGHFRRYTKTTLGGVVRQAGFQIETLKYFDLLGMLPWFVTGRVLKKDTVGSGGTALYDKFIVPICKTVDLATKPRVGKNLSLVAHKPR